MKLFCFILISVFCVSESFAQVREERVNLFDNSFDLKIEKETQEDSVDRVTLASEDATEAEKIVKEITETLCHAVKETDIKSYLNCLSKEKREKDKMKIVKQFMMEKIPNLDVLKTFILDESEDQIDFIAKYCSNGEWIYLSEVTLTKEDGRFVVSKEKVMETTSNTPTGFPERNAHLKGLDPNVPIMPCHRGENCRFANAAGHRLVEQQEAKKVVPFQPQVDTKRIPDRPFNQNGNNVFVDDNGGVREVHANGWVSVPKNGPQFVDLNQLKKFYPDRYSGCKDGNCANGRCRVR